MRERGPLLLPRLGVNRVARNPEQDGEGFVWKERAPTPIFLEVFILKGFKCSVLEVRIPKGLQAGFAEVRILKRLVTRDWRIVTGGGERRSCRGLDLLWVSWAAERGDEHGPKGPPLQSQERAVRGRGWCERNMGNDSREFNYCQGTVPGYLSFE